VISQKHRFALYYKGGEGPIAYPGVRLVHFPSKKVEKKGDFHYSRKKKRGPPLTAQGGQLSDHFYLKKGREREGRGLSAVQGKRKGVWTVNVAGEKRRVALISRKRGKPKKEGTGRIVNPAGEKAWMPDFMPEGGERGFRPLGGGKIL